MKALITKRSIIIASTALLIALVSLASVTFFNNAGPVTGAANVITRPVRALASTVAETFANIYASIYRYETLVRRNEELLQIIARQEADFRDSVALAQENDQLRTLLLFRERHGKYAHEMATLVNWNSDNWTHSFIINKGYNNSDVTRGMGIATESGILIGQITDVGAVQSTVRTVLDTTFSAAVFIGGDNAEESDGTATVRGDFTQMRNGLLIIDQIDNDSNVIPGSLIVTSGRGGRFPVGLSVGLVEKVETHSSGIGRYATVAPLVDFDNIRTVFIITDFENPD